MPDVFNAQSEGSVVALSIGRAIPGAIQIDGLESRNLVVSRFGVSRNANAQFMPTLRNSIFIYSFGDKIGEMEVSGVAFHRLCNGSGNSGDSFAGLAEVGEFYDSKGLGAAKDNSIKPVYVSLGTISIKAFLIGVQVSSLNPESNLMQFSLQFAVIPTKTGTAKKK